MEKSESTARVDAAHRAWFASEHEQGRRLRESGDATADRGELFFHMRRSAVGGRLRTNTRADRPQRLGDVGQAAVNVAVYRHLGALELTFQIRLRVVDDHEI